MDAEDLANEIITRMAEEIRNLRARIYLAHKELLCGDPPEAEKMLTSIHKIRIEYGWDD